MLPRAYFVAMRGTFNPQAAVGLDATYELQVDNLVFEVRIREGRITTPRGAAKQSGRDHADGRRDAQRADVPGPHPAAALESGRVRVNGSADALEKFVGVFAFPNWAGVRETSSAHAVRRASVGARRAARKAG